jgi:hypothetical protein
MNTVLFRKSIIMILAMFLVMSVVACESIQKYIAKPETTPQKFAYMKSTIADLNNSAGELLKAEVITFDQAQQYYQRSLQTKLLIDSAETAFKFQDIETAEAKLKEAESMLINLEMFIESFREPAE